jgi:pyrrolidone-carboxylate peptidase
MKELFGKIGRGIIYLSFGSLLFINSDKDKDNIFLTGFGDTPDIKNNPTTELMKHFAREGYNTVVFDADYDKAPSELNEIYNKFKPKKIISMGVSKIPFYFNVSIVANNMMHASKPDNSGKIYLYTKIDSAFPEEIYLSEKDTKELISNFNKENIDFSADSTEGTTYVCNSLLFKGINLSKKKGFQFYFFHVPYDILKDKNKLDNLERAVETVARN